MNSHHVLFCFLWWGLEFRHYLPHQSTVRSPEKMTRDGYRVSFLDTKSSGSSPEKDLIPRPDTYPCIHDGSLGKRLDVGDSNQILPYQLPSDVSLDCYDNHYSQTLSLHGSLVKKPQKIKNYRECSIKPSNDIKATSSHSCGDLLTSLSNPDSSTGRLLKLSSGKSCQFAVFLNAWILDFIETEFVVLQLYIRVISCPWNFQKSGGFGCKMMDNLEEKI